MPEKFNSTILVAPLDWGLGHSTRCIPIIRYLQLIGCKVIIAAEGAQQKLLQQEFPALQFIHLPGYRIEYSINKRFFNAKILLQLPKIYWAMRYERKWLKRIIEEHKIDGVISDNRYGLSHPDTPCVFITHQLKVKAPFGLAEKLLQRICYAFINKYSQCWVPDEPGSENLAGLLSHPASLPRTPVKYLGAISRFRQKLTADIIYDLLIVLSGPEPQRTVLENKMLDQLKTFEGKALLVRGLPGEIKAIQIPHNIAIKNHLSSYDMETAFNESEFIISRSGYTTVMDICKLQKKAILIPTPGQTEQEYLAKHLKDQRWCLSVEQDEFDLAQMLHRAKAFSFKMTVFAMESYKKVVEEFVSTL